MTASSGRALRNGDAAWAGEGSASANANAAIRLIMQTEHEADRTTSLMMDAAETRASVAMDRLGRSASLIGMGLLLLVGGYLLERARRRLLGRFRETAP